jgi:hypothetical protein
MREYAKTWQPEGENYCFHYDHWVQSSKHKIAGRIKTSFTQTGVKSTYAIVYINDLVLYKHLFTGEIHPALIGGFIGRDMIHELRHQYQYSQWPQRMTFKLHQGTARGDYLKRHTEIDAFATGAAFGYLMYGTCFLGKDYKSIECMIRFLLSSTEGQKAMLDLVPELSQYFNNKHRYPTEYRKFLKKSYKYFNTLLNIHTDEQPATHIQDKTP